MEKNAEYENSQFFLLLVLPTSNKIKETIVMSSVSTNIRYKGTLRVL